MDTPWASSNFTSSDDFALGLLNDPDLNDPDRYGVVFLEAWAQDADDSPPVIDGNAFEDAALRTPRRPESQRWGGSTLPD